MTVAVLGFHSDAAQKVALEKTFAGFAVAPLLGLAVAYWVTRMELTRC